MLAELGLTESGWEQTPQAVRTALVVLWQQNLRQMNRCATYEAQFELLHAQVT